MKIYFLNSRELDSFSSLFLNVIPFRVCVSIAVKKKIMNQSPSQPNHQTGDDDDDGTVNPVC